MNEFTRIREAITAQDIRQATARIIDKMSTPLTKEEIRKDREYWGSMPWHPIGMKHPALKTPRSRNRKVRYG